MKLPLKDYLPSLVIYFVMMFVFKYFNKDPTIFMGLFIGVLSVLCIDLIKYPTTLRRSVKSRR